jgi:hypothetical protein
MSSTCNAVLNPSGVLVGSGGYYLAIALLVFTPLFMISTCIAFLYFQNSSMLLRKRQFVTQLITCFQITSLLSYTAIYDVVGADKFPCLLLAVTFNVFAAVQAFNLIVKITANLNNTAEVELGKEIAAESAAADHKSRPGSGRSSLSSLFRPTYIPVDVSWKTFRALRKFVFAKDPSKLSLDTRIEALQFMKSTTYMCMFGPPVLFVAIVTMAVRIGLDPDMQNNCTGCRVSLYEAVVQLVLTAWGMLLSRYIRYGSLANDTLRLQAEVRETLGFPYAMLWILGLVLYLADPDGVNHTFNWLTLCLFCNMFMLFNHVWKLIFISWRLRRQMFQTKRDLPACFEEVYADPDLKHALCVLLDSEMSSEVYWFYDSVKFYKRTFEGDNERSKELAKFNMENYVLSR